MPQNGEGDPLIVRVAITTTVLIAISPVAVRHARAAPVNLAEQGWTISADAEKTALMVRHERTGSLLEDVQLQLRGPKGLVRVEKWSLSAAPHEMSIITEAPRTRWIFAPTRDTLRISCTSSNAIVIARIPAGKDRLVARLLEEDGVPVVWSGTDEVVGSYGGTCTRNPSALPASNPECAYFNGNDVYNNWNGRQALFDSINANAFLNHLVVYVMAGEGMELGPRMTVNEASRVRPPSVVETARQREEPMTGFGVTAAEARTLVSLTSLTGVAYSLASVMPELPADRTKLVQRTLPTMPILPADLFSRGGDVEWATFKHVRADDRIHNYPEILDLKINAVAGVYDVVGLVNWRQTKATKEISFSRKLGIEPLNKLCGVRLLEPASAGDLQGPDGSGDRAARHSCSAHPPVAGKAATDRHFPAYHRRLLDARLDMGRVQEHPARLFPDRPRRHLRALRECARRSEGNPSGSDLGGSGRRTGATGPDGQLPEDLLCRSAAAGRVADHFRVGTLVGKSAYGISERVKRPRLGRQCQGHTGSKLPVASGVHAS